MKLSLEEVLKRLRRHPNAQTEAQTEGFGTVSVAAVITRADGTVEDLGTIGSGPMFLAPEMESGGDDA